MNKTLQLAVVADDLTGGADTGVQFCPVFGPVYLAWMQGGAVDLNTMETAGISLCTNSRHLSPRDAERQMEQAAAVLKHYRPAIIYKKIDSSLRGSPGVEIDVLLRETGGELSFIAPSLPGQGRTTENDIHRIHGVNVAETEAGRDPRSPVTTSCLSARIAEGSSRPVGHVSLGTLEEGADAAARRIRKLREAGCVHMVFDATTDRHLDRIISVQREQFSGCNILLAGSAGLAQALARSLSEPDSRRPATIRPRIGKWLMVCGSMSRITRIQAAKLAESEGWSHLTIAAAALADGDPGAAAQLAEELAAGRAQANLVLSIAPVNDEDKNVLVPEQVISGLARLTAKLIAKAPPQGLLLTGGDTAEAVLTATAARGLVLREEILSGLMLGTVDGGLCHAVTVVTKAGAFGAEDTLLQLTAALS